MTSIYIVLAHVNVADQDHAPLAESLDRQQLDLATTPLVASGRCGR